MERGNVSGRPWLACSHRGHFRRGASSVGYNPWAQPPIKSARMTLSSMAQAPYCSRRAKCLRFRRSMLRIDGHGMALSVGGGGRRASRMQELDVPALPLVMQHSGLQPAHGLRPGGIAHRAADGVADPRPITSDVNFGVVDRPDEGFTCAVSGFDHLRKLHAVEALAVVEGI